MQNTWRQRWRKTKQTKNQETMFCKKWNASQTMLTLTSQTSKTRVNSVDHSLGSEEPIPSDARVAVRVGVPRLWYDHKMIQTQRTSRGLKNLRNTSDRCQYLSGFWYLNFGDLTAIFFQDLRKLWQKIKIFVKIIFIRLKDTHNFSVKFDSYFY